MIINQGQPSAYDLVFPVFGGNITGTNQFVPKEIYGTAFPIGNDFFVTCAHTVNAAKEAGNIVLGFKSQNDVKFVEVGDTEVFEENDSALLKVNIGQVQPLRWMKQKLAMLNDVVSFGHPYGFDLQHAEVLVRAFKGHIMLVGFNHNFNKNPHYELSFSVPRGLSGAPLVFVKGQDLFICGHVIGNEMTDMIVQSFKETEESTKTTIYYEKTETLHRGIAMQIGSFLEIKSNLLGMTLGEYLMRNKLLI